MVWGWARGITNVLALFLWKTLGDKKIALLLSGQWGQTCTAILFCLFVCFFMKAATHIKSSNICKGNIQTWFHRTLFLLSSVHQRSQYSHRQHPSQRDAQTNTHPSIQRGEMLKSPDHIPYSIFSYLYVYACCACLHKSPSWTLAAEL